MFFLRGVCYPFREVFVRTSLGSQRSILSMKLGSTFSKRSTALLVGAGVVAGTAVLAFRIARKRQLSPLSCEEWENMKSRLPLDLDLLAGRIIQGGMDCRLRTSLWPLLLGFPTAVDGSPQKCEEARKDYQAQFDNLRAHCAAMHAESSTPDKSSKANSASDTVASSSTPSKELIEFHEAVSIIALDAPRTRALQPLDGSKPDQPTFERRLKAIMEAYALDDPEIGYCQGMADLVAPFLQHFPKDPEAFVYFSMFMHLFARDNFRRDGSGVEERLSHLGELVSEVDPKLHHHLHKIDASQCYFMHKPLLLLFLRSFPPSQVLVLWDIAMAEVRQCGGELPQCPFLLYALLAVILLHRKELLRCSELFELMSVFHGPEGLNVPFAKLLKGNIIIFLQGPCHDVHTR
ncbi:hypothetical protein CYMTET_52432 [Cymbomonas tetramitiformis]|uniref:Rab-GAP TBC domain-containing protein n=1 Tax=Cymbomonas tetramitiformis TaxID=36881 RepID=A0AAE0BKQ4_9CHLO|nr:hypothetical protein CYMTET_52432 [Cymbomonas tetramitiformis]